MLKVYVLFGEGVGDYSCYSDPNEAFNEIYDGLVEGNCRIETYALKTKGEKMAFESGLACADEAVDEYLSGPNNFWIVPHPMFKRFHMTAKLRGDKIDA